MSETQRNVGRPKRNESESEKQLRLQRRRQQKNEYDMRNREKYNARKKKVYESNQIRENCTTSAFRSGRTTFPLGLLDNVEDIEVIDIGDMNTKCAHCNGLSFKNEQGRSKHSCCHGGKIKINMQSTYPEELKNLLYGTDNRSKHFREKIRVYNNAFAFASFNSTNSDIVGRGPYCMRILGDTKRKATTSLLSKSNPRYGQIYIYDDNETVKHRLQLNLREDILLALQEVMKLNPYANKYRQLYKVYQETGESTVSLNFVKFGSDDIRRYNTPTCDQIAAIIVSHDGTVPENVDVKVFPINEKESDFLSTTSHHADPMIFPLLFPSGESGWSYLMKTECQKNISPLQFYSHKLAIRDNEFNPIFACGRLTQQYIINCYLTVESQRLKYLKLNQSSLRTECYQGLVDHIQNSEANNGDIVRIGNMLILPSTFQGSARSMQQLYQDAMAICRKIGRPDLFITMTCNPNWPEIKRYLQQLPAGTTANDIPHFTTRLFHQKTLSLISDLPKLFGNVKAYVYTIEFQKRGLPHMHLLVTLEKKLLTADDIDRFISAEIPNKAHFPSLWYKVTKHMLHGPHVPGLLCYDEGRSFCKKNFPKPFSDVTDMSQTGFPKYRRRNNVADMNTYHGKNNGRIIQVDNSMVVPYNPYLLMKYDCHINVEYCASIMGIKYIHKYIHKGHDKARIHISNSTSQASFLKDEIQDFLDTRYLSATECAWRLFELPLHGRSHSVERLPIHLPGMNRVIFEEGKESNAVEANVNTKLTAYFELNKSDSSAKTIKYEDIPLQYRWMNGKKMWQKRKYHCSTVSRLICVSSKSVEQFHLKLLLRKTTGAVSFDDLKTVEGVRYKTFKEAATSLGLVINDTEMEEVMREASLTLMPSQLRHFFVYILVGCESVNAKDLWEKFEKQLSEDKNELQALIIINDLLEKENSSLENFGIQKPDVILENIEESIDVEYFTAEYGRLYKMLNKDQKHAFDTITSMLNDKSQNCFFIDGPGGSGKTFLYRCLINYATSEKKKIFTIAWTGIAAILLPFGRTAHKSFQLPINLQEKSTLFWNKRTKKTLVEIDIFLWDEASMIPAVALESIDIALRDICCCSEPFGGKIMLLGGDFRQVLPVVKRAGRTQIISSTIKKCSLWNEFRCFHLMTNMRATSSEDGFSEWLLSIGNGDIKTMNVTDDHYCTDLVKEMYYNIDPGLLTSQAILTPRNDDVSLINNRIIEQLPGDIIDLFGIDYVTARGTDSADESTELSYPLEYINTLTPSGFPPFCLKLKVGAIVMLIRNLCVADGLCNGTRLLVRGIQRRILCCQILTGDKAGNDVFIPRIKLDSSADLELPFVLHRTQFPVRVAFCMTINKSQGQTFERVGIYIMDNHPIFTHGQLYVALSRCKSYSGIKIQLSKENMQRSIENIVFDEVL